MSHLLLPCLTCPLSYTVPTCRLDSVVAHMQEEETTVLPQLAAVLDAESQLRLGILFEAAKVGRGASACHAV